MEPKAQPKFLSFWFHAPCTENKENKKRSACPETNTKWNNSLPEWIFQGPSLQYFLGPGPNRPKRASPQVTQVPELTIRSADAELPGGRSCASWRRTWRGRPEASEPRRRPGNPAETVSPGQKIVEPQNGLPWSMETWTLGPRAHGFILTMSTSRETPPQLHWNVLNEASWKAVLRRTFYDTFWESGGGSLPLRPFPRGVKNLPSKDSWQWLKQVIPKWQLGKWNRRLTPAYPQLLIFEPFPFPLLIFKLLKAQVLIRGTGVKHVIRVANTWRQKCDICHWA